MKRAIMLALSIFGLLLSACAQATPTVETTPQTVPTLAPTSSLPGMGSMSAIGAPTADPTAASEAEPAQTYTVQRGTIEDTLSFSGQVAPVQSSISFDIDGVVGKVYVQPGQTVQQGDLVAELEMSAITGQLREARLTLQQNQRLLDQAAQGGEVAIKQAELDLEAAQQALEKLKAPALPVDIAEAQTAVRQAQSNLETVRNNASQTKNTAITNRDQAVRDLQSIQEDYGKKVNLLQRTKDPSEKKDLADTIKDLETQIHEAESAVALAQIDYDTARNNEVAAVKEAEAQLDLAKARLEALLRGPDQFEIAAQEREVRRAELAVTQARVEGSPDPALTLAVESSRLQIEDLEQEISKNQLFAPYGGEVTSIDAVAGDTVQIGTPVLSLVDNTRIEILADSAAIENSNRKSAPQLRVGQSLTITFSRYPGQVLSGTISLSPNDQASESTDTNYHITFDTQALTLEPGDLADLQVNLGRKYDALWLPPEAVKFSGNRATVVVRVDGEDKRIEVPTGIVTDKEVEILNGLKEGDVVIGQ